MTYLLAVHSRYAAASLCTRVIDLALVNSLLHIRRQSATYIYRLR